MVHKYSWLDLSQGLYGEFPYLFLSNKVLRIQDTFQTPNEDYPSFRELSYILYKVALCLTVV